MTESMIISLSNTKGGVGKSTLAVHLAIWLHDQGFRTALLDADKQRSSSQWVAEAEPSISVRVASTPEECLSEVTGLAKSHDFVVADSSGGLDELSRSLALLADLVLLPLCPSILDLRSLQRAVTILHYAQGINRGRPDATLILNKFRSRDRISRELRTAAPGLAVTVATTVIRDLQAYRDAAGQGTVVTRMGKRAKEAKEEIDQLFASLFPQVVSASDHKEKILTTKEVVHG